VDPGLSFRATNRQRASNEKRLPPATLPSGLRSTTGLPEQPNGTATAMRLSQEAFIRNRSAWPRHAQQAQIGLESLMAPVLAFARAMRDPMQGRLARDRAISDASRVQPGILKGVQRLQKAERLARGVKVIDTEPISAPGSSQGGAQWVVIHQPPRSRTATRSQPAIRS
jgi:hypothetical protein